MKAARFEDLPTERTCNHCGETKPRDEMIVQFHRSRKYYYFRPRCKECHNKHERMHRREYKTKYQRRWRRENAVLNDSYWRGNDQVREAARVRAANRSPVEKDAIAIQRRMNRRGYAITIAEAREYLEKYGRCFPTRLGLTPAGLAECERIRSALRRKNSGRRSRDITATDIRLMVYEEGGSFVIPTYKQPQPYKYFSRRLTQYHRNKRILEGERMVAAA